MVIVHTTKATMPMLLHEEMLRCSNWFDLDSNVSTLQYHLRDADAEEFPLDVEMVLKTMDIPSLGMKAFVEIVPAKARESEKRECTVLVDRVDDGGFVFS